MDSVAGPSHQAAAARHNLPTHLTSFVGREADLRSLRSLLRSSRLVTLTGTGGAGKSRLAAEAARANSAAWPDGVWWFELADETDVAAAVVARLELPGLGSPDEVVASWLAFRRALLILDNCEHVIAQSASLSHFLLQRCPEISILATSREPLGVAGEVRWPVSSLGDLDALSLFEVRARLVAPDYRVAAPNRGPVVAICERLDRLPLAIEMAAARLDLMSEHELLANLNDRFRLLASGARTVPERQQTMAAAIDWSYRLLSEDEAQLFRRLAVFQGGFTLEAARAVGANGDVLSLLTRLVQKSLVVADRRADGTTRYRLLESHHDFARHQLVESGEVDQVQRRHYYFFSTRKWEPVESANFWYAVTWARENAEDGGLRLAVEIGDADFSDQPRAKKLILDLLEKSPPAGSLHARAMTMAARLAWRQGDRTAGRALTERAVAAARTVGDPELLAQALIGAGVVHETGGELALAGQMYDEALALLSDSTNRQLVANVSNGRGLLAIAQGDLATALEFLGRSVASARLQDDHALVARCLESLANAQLESGQVELAAASWNESLAVFREVNDWLGIIWSLVGLALVASERRQDDRAVRLAAAADRLSREYSLTAWSYRVTQLDEAIRQARTRLASRGKGDAAWNEGQTMTTADALEYALSGHRAPGEALPDAGPLSRREREVVVMVAAGMTNKQIAQRLFIAERTAEGHVERIRNKLGVRSRTEVATWAIAHGLKPRSLDDPA